MELHLIRPLGSPAEPSAFSRQPWAAHIPESRDAFTSFVYPHYAINGLCSSPPGTGYETTNWGSKTFSAIKHPSLVALFGDNRHRTNPNIDYSGLAGDTAVRRASFRHSGNPHVEMAGAKANFCFTDGHVEGLTYLQYKFFSNSSQAGAWPEGHKIMTGPKSVGWIMSF